MKCLFVAFLLGVSVWGRPESEPTGDICERPEPFDDEEGTCTFLCDCPSLLEAFTRPTLSQTWLKFLKLSTCNGMEKMPSFCCSSLPSLELETEKHEPRPTQVLDSNSDLSVEEDSHLESKDKCGIDNKKRISTALITDLDEFPWTALMGYRTSNGNMTYQCGGMLINHRYILTAAMCVSGDERSLGTLETVRLGEYDKRSDPSCMLDVCAEPVQEIRVEAVYPHPGFFLRGKNLGDNIAIVRLAKRARYSEFVKPICLPDSEQRQATGLEVFVAGWANKFQGYKFPVKLKVVKAIHDKEDCVAKYRILNAELTDKVICAGDALCRNNCLEGVRGGDSGSPLMRKNSDNWEAIGVASFGYGRSKDCWPEVYTSISSYADWIHETIRLSNV